MKNGLLDAERRLSDQTISREDCCLPTPEPDETTKREILRKLRCRLKELETSLAPDWPPLMP
jgi:hypothetical protein